MRNVYVGARRSLAAQEWETIGWAAAQAERLAAFNTTGIGPYVLVVDGDQVDPLRHHVCHSPSGFEWGYLGSGSAELARCILIDHLARAARKRPEVLADYQEFAQAIVAQLPRIGVWTLTSEEIETWARRTRRATA